MQGLEHWSCESGVMSSHLAGPDDETVVEGAIGKGLCREVTFQMRFQGREGKGCSF